MSREVVLFHFFLYLFHRLTADDAKLLPDAVGSLHPANCFVTYKNKSALWTRMERERAVHISPSNTYVSYRDTKKWEKLSWTLLRHQVFFFVISLTADYHQVLYNIQVFFVKWKHFFLILSIVVRMKCTPPHVSDSCSYPSLPIPKCGECDCVW